MRRVVWAGLLGAAFFGVACGGRGERSAAASAGLPIADASEWQGERAFAPAPDVRPAALPPGAWVLHFGDSFVAAAFQRYLGPHVRSAGARYVVRSQDSTYTTTWANDRRLDTMLSLHPSLVIVTLGANEFDITDPEQHGRAIETIARKIARSGATCVWTSPPMWKPDTGIVQVIHDHCAPCLFFDSDAVLGGLSPAERRGDRIHPNELGGERWADALWGWVTSHRDVEQPGWGLAAYERRGG